ncbi:hypothetical protein AAY473_016751, partial [Plecturocebus cupreus]
MIKIAAAAVSYAFYNNSILDLTLGYSQYFFFKTFLSPKVFPVPSPSHTELFLCGHVTKFSPTENDWSDRIKFCVENPCVGQESSAPRPWTSTGLRLIRNQAAQQKSHLESLSVGARTSEIAPCLESLLTAVGAKVEAIPLPLASAQCLGLGLVACDLVRGMQMAVAFQPGSPGNDTEALGVVPKCSRIGNEQPASNPSQCFTETPTQVALKALRSRHPEPG